MKSDVDTRHYLHVGLQACACGGMEYGSEPREGRCPYGGAAFCEGRSRFFVFLQQLHIAVASGGADVGGFGGYPHALEVARHGYGVGYAPVQLVEAYGAVGHLLTGVNFLGEYFILRTGRMRARPSGRSLSA